MNVAVRASTADIVVLTNPEIEHTSAVLVKMIGLLDSPDTYVTASCFEPERQLWLAGPKTMYGKNGRQPVPEGSHFHFCAMLHRSLFERAGGFDEDYRTGQGCDDNDWLWRLNSIGAKFVHCDDSVTHYRTRHRWTGTTQRNASILRKKWGHSW
jgi:GT2 family glycosyltransferase